MPDLEAYRQRMLEARMATVTIADDLVDPSQRWILEEDRVQPTRTILPGWLVSDYTFCCKLRGLVFPERGHLTYRDHEGRIVRIDGELACGEFLATKKGP